MAQAQCEITRFGSEQDLCRAVAARWSEWVAGGSPRPGESACLALSGGRIADRLFPEFVAAIRARGRPLDAIQFFWADERCVPPKDPESNFNTANRLLFLPLQVPATQVHRIRGELPPEVAAAEAEAEISRIASLSLDGYPLLDLVLLGMGEDGHTASLFPQAATSVPLPTAAYVAVEAPKPPSRRITLNYRCLALAKEAWVLVSGRGKQAALTASLAPASLTPLGRVLQMRSYTRLFIHTPDSD